MATTTTTNTRRRQRRRLVSPAPGATPIASTTTTTTTTANTTTTPTANAAATTTDANTTATTTTTITSLLLPYRCLYCGQPSDNVIDDSATTPRSLQLALCKGCARPVDELVEHDAVLLMMDTLLLRPSAYRHLIFNRAARSDVLSLASTSDFVRILVPTLLAEAYVRMTCLLQTNWSAATPLLPAQTLPPSSSQHHQQQQQQQQHSIAEERLGLFNKPDSSSSVVLTTVARLLFPDIIVIHHDSSTAYNSVTFYPVLLWTVIDTFVFACACACALTCTAAFLSNTEGTNKSKKLKTPSKLSLLTKRGGGGGGGGADHHGIQSLRSDSINTALSRLPASLLLSRLGVFIFAVMTIFGAASSCGAALVYAIAMRVYLFLAAITALAEGPLRGRTYVFSLYVVSTAVVLQWLVAQPLARHTVETVFGEGGLVDTLRSVA